MFTRRLALLCLRSSACSYSSSAPKSSSQQLVSLFSNDGKIVGIKTKTEAEAMAKKSNVMLKRHHLPHGQESKHPAYILFDPKSEFDEAVDKTAPVSITGKGKKSARASGVRDKKRVTIGATINDHDIETKAKTIAKFLKANCEVQILSYGHVKNERLEEIYKKFEQIFAPLRLVQKIIKPGSLKFTILPDAEKFSGLSFKDTKPDSADEDIDADAFIDEKELEELVEEKLKEKKH